MSILGNILKLNIQQKKYIDNINDERARLTEELARYKQEAEKIPNRCSLIVWDLSENEGAKFKTCHQNEQCPQICPKWRGGNK